MSSATEDTPKLKGGPFVVSNGLPEEAAAEIRGGKALPPAWQTYASAAFGVFLQAAFTVGLIGILLAAAVRATKWILGV